jgi:ketosteroid isomerase-like protein
MMMNTQGEIVDELMENERKILRMMQAGEIDKAMDTYLMKDAIVCPPGMDRIVGRENQKSMFNELLKMDWNTFYANHPVTHVNIWSI